MSARSRAAELLELLESYEPASDRSDRLTYRDILRRFPSPSGENESRTPVAVSHFAALAYCPYTIWHRVRGTPVVRPRRVQKLVEKGTKEHSVREEKLLEVVAKAKPASELELKDPFVNLVELPEVQARIERGRWLYLARLDGLARLAGNVVIRELKTGRWMGSADHLLQVWAYSVAAPGALESATKGLLRANGLLWEIHYPSRGEVWGPYDVTGAQLRLLTETMEFFETTASMSATSEELDLGWTPSVGKCNACGFAHQCRWRALGAPPTPGALDG